MPAVAQSRPGLNNNEYLLPLTITNKNVVLLFVNNQNNFIILISLKIFDVLKLVLIDRKGPYL